MKVVLFLVTATILSSCVTTGLETPEAQRLSSMIASHCATYGTFGVRKLHERPVVMNINYGKFGWIQVDFASGGMRDNFYLNERQGRSECGHRMFAHRGGKFERISEQEFRQENDASPTRAGSVLGPKTASAEGSTGVRKIVVTWEGFLVSANGTLEWEKTATAGTAKLRFDHESLTCASSFTDSSRTSGTWSVHCGVDRVAAGTVTYLGKDRGAIGSGTDDRGNQVRFTIMTPDADQ